MFDVGRPHPIHGVGHIEREEDRRMHDNFDDGVADDAGSATRITRTMLSSGASTNVN